MQINRKQIVRVLASGLILSGAVAAQNPTQAELEKGQRYLTETRKGVQNAAKGMTEAQWNFKPGPDRWSAAEVVEHLALIEDVVLGVLAKLPQGPAPPADWDAKGLDAKLLAQVPDRSTKYEAPPQARPTARWSPEQALEHFLASRARTAELLRTMHDLRGHVIAHPVFGPMDGYQWVLAVAAHSERHTKQILEVKADPKFPARATEALASPTGYTEEDFHALHVPHLLAGEVRRAKSGSPGCVEERPSRGD
jgi:hypothetical protein